MKNKLTIEEKLQAALVPEEEQPYKVPENWCWVRLGGITDVVGGGTPSSKVKEYYEGGTIPWISPADLSGYKGMYISRGARNITELGLEKSSAKLMPKNTVLLSSRAPIGYVAISENEISTNQGFKSFLPSPTYIPKYLYWYLKGAKELLESYASGTTFLELSASKASRVEFPLAPSNEQYRIVARIESLFAKLDEAKEKIQEVLDGADLRRAAILHQAFTGKLTEKWRREKGVSYESWEETMFDDCIDKMQNGLSKRKGSAGESYAVLRLANIGVVDVNTDDLRYIMLDDKEISKYELNHGDVLMIRVNGSRDNVGKQIYVKNPIKWAFCDHLIRIKYKDGVSAQFMCLLSETHSYRRYIEDNMVSSAGQNTISRKGMQDYKVNLPSMSEQKEIVRLLDNLLSLEQSTVTACEEALTTIDTLKKSILARAFRGELGTNDPSEAGAQELLQEILAS